MSQRGNKAHKCFFSAINGMPHPFTPMVIPIHNYLHQELPRLVRRTGLLYAATTLTPNILSEFGLGDRWTADQFRGDKVRYISYIEDNGPDYGYQLVLE